MIYGGVMGYLDRIIRLELDRTFFLWGPRQTGKTSLLKQKYPDAFWVNLLESDTYARYVRAPHLLREQLQDLAVKNRAPTLIIIDEIQKLPVLLDEVHLLIEDKGYVFGLCGSSARKVKRGHANLLGGRATRYELFGFVREELAGQFDLVRICNHGYLPSAYLSNNPRRFFRSYVGDYLKEEIAAEGLVRKLPAFSNFLRAAAITDTEVVNYTNIASDCSVSKSAAQGYFQILDDTLLGSFLSAYTRRPKRRTIHAPKFYFSDVGIVNHLAKRGSISPGSELFGKAFENYIYHELRAYAAYSEKYFDLSYWRLTTGVEVDFVIEDVHTAIEVKSIASVNSRHLKGLREISKDFSPIQHRIVVSLERQSRQTKDGIRILPVHDFLTELWSGEII